MTDPPRKPKTGLIDEETFESSLHGDDAEATRPLSSGADDGLPGKDVPMEAEILGEPKQPAWVGRQLGHFKLLRLLGKGAMGMVIQAQDVNLGRIVALKVLRKRIKGMDDAQKVQQFLREAKAVARIEHPNVAPIYEINQHDGWWYIASEFIEGGSLRDVVRAAGPLSPARACPIIADAASALDAVHQTGMVHRDVKPSNIMLTRTGRAKLVDFGLVRIDDPNDPFDFTDQTIGTPHYMAPELVRRKPATAASDVYSLGASLYYTLTGGPPFQGQDMQDILDQHVSSSRPDVRDAAPACSESLAKLIQRAMAVEPSQRPTVAEMARALRAESIGVPDEDSRLILGPDGSGAPLSPAGRSTITGLSRVGTSVVVAPASRSRWNLVVRLAAVVVLIVAAIQVVRWVWSPADPAVRPPRPAADHAAFHRRFPDAPTHYGQPDAPPQITTHTPPLPFAYLSLHDAGEFRFAAHRLGRRYYPIDSPEAAMIPADGFVGYRTAADAEAAGRRAGGQ